jgi:hypothetical protein
MKLVDPALGLDVLLDELIGGVSEGRRGRQYHEYGQDPTHISFPFFSGTPWARGLERVIVDQKAALRVP